jgi:hypothetical protein
MTKPRTSTGYIFTADPLSAADMQQIDVIKKTVKAINDSVMQSHKYAVMRAEYQGLPAPKKPNRQRVRLMGRGPRRVHAQTRYGGRYNSAYDSYLPQKHATRFDVYIATEYNR